MSTNKSKFENLIDFLRVILWPLIVIILIIIYSTDVSKLIRVIPNKVEQSSKLTVGDFSFEIDKTAKQFGSEELSGVIHNLSENAIRRLLTLGGNGQSLMAHGSDYLAFPGDYNVLIELEKNELIKPNEHLIDFYKYYQDLKPEQPLDVFIKDGYLYHDKKDTSYPSTLSSSIKRNKLSPEQYKRLSDMGVVLSEKGKKAFDIIVHAVSEQINK